MCLMVVEIGVRSDHVDLGDGVRRRALGGVAVDRAQAPERPRQEERSHRSARRQLRKEGGPVNPSLDLLVLVGVVAAVGAAVLYAFVADRMVSGR